MHETVLQASNLNKRFHETRALADVGFDLKSGEIHGLVGENGAGKSTLIKILSGVLQADSGEVLLQGRPRKFGSPLDAQRAGINTVYQEVNLVEQLSIAENVFANSLPCSAGGIVGWKRLYRDTERYLEMFGLDLPPHRRVLGLPLATKRIIEICAALRRQGGVFIFDEATAALSDEEITRLFSAIRRLRESGVGIIYVSHQLREVFQLADRITVLRDGQRVGTFQGKEVDQGFIIEKMVGRNNVPIQHGRRKGSASLEQTPPLLELDHVAGRGFEDINLRLEKGRIVGLAGLMGDGRRELSESLFGLRPLRSGKFRIDGKEVLINSPQEAIRKGIGWIPEDRKLQGLFLRMSLQENVAAVRLDRFARRGVIRYGQQRGTVEELVNALRIRTTGLRQKVGTLSGGNQQKVLFAKWASIKPKVLVVNNPTTGVDIGAKAEIHEVLRRLAAEDGVGILLISSDLPELLSLTDGLLVFHRTRIVRELLPEEASEAAILQWANHSQV